MANAPVLKTGVRKDLGVRIPRPPLDSPSRIDGLTKQVSGASSSVSYNHACKLDLHLSLLIVAIGRKRRRGSLSNGTKP